MRPINLVLAQHSGVPSLNLAGRLRTQFRNVATSQSVEEIRAAVARSRAPLAVVDVELIGLEELKRLCSEFPATAFVAIHRLADEEIWAEALAAGAVDCCAADDLHSILKAADRYAVTLRAKAMAAA